MVAPDGRNVYVAAFAHRGPRRPHAQPRHGPGAAEAGPIGLPRRSQAARVRGGARCPRHQLDRDQPGRPLRLFDLLRQQCSRRLQEERMSETHDRDDGLTRKELLQSGAGAAAGLLLAQSGLGSALAATQAKRNPIEGMNVILFLTDQERAIQHFPPRWMQRNLPGMMRLRSHGLSFERAFTNACMCSPARSTLMSGYFPAQHGVKYTLEEDMPASQGYPQVELPLPRTLPNLATVMAGGGLQRRLQGQVALLQAPARPGGRPGRPREVRLQPLESARRRRGPEHPPGRRRVHRQRRPLHGRGGQSRGQCRGNPPVPLDRRRETAAVLHGDLTGQPARRPLLSGHDVRASGYDSSWTKGDIQIPRTNGEDLSTKPTVQRAVPAASST